LMWLERGSQLKRRYDRFMILLVRGLKFRRLSTQKY
jgi:hypothetical protein